MTEDWQVPHIREPWHLRLWWFVVGVLAYVVAGLALLAGAALIVLTALS